MRQCPPSAALRLRSFFPVEATHIFKSKIFTGWYFSALSLWVVLFSVFNNIPFLIKNWFYPAMMVAGAFVAGFTPEGGGAVAFPVLSVFMHFDRAFARDFSMMIQSVGMTSASVFILTESAEERATYKPLLWFVPTCGVGMVLGMLYLQKIPVYIIHALFLALSATFVITYYFSDHRGPLTTLVINTNLEKVYLVVVLVVGGMISSLFGTGGDVIVYLLLVTHFNMMAKKACRMSIILQASISILGYSYRAFYDHGLTNYQIRSWLCAFPVVLFMAPFGAYVLSKLHVNWMLKGIIALNIFQLMYFNLKDPTWPKVYASVIFTTILGVLFYFVLKHMSNRNKAILQQDPAGA